MSSKRDDGILKTSKSETLKNFKVRVQKSKPKNCPLAKLAKDQRYFENNKVSIPKSVVQKLGLYEAVNVYLFREISLK